MSWFLGCVDAKSLQSCPTLHNPVDCSLPGSSIHWIFQARILAWLAMPCSRASSQCRDRTHVSYDFCIASGFFTAELPGKTIVYFICWYSLLNELIVSGEMNPMNRQHELDGIYILRIIIIWTRRLGSTRGDSGLVQFWWIFVIIYKGGLSGKESTCQCRRYKRCGFHPWDREDPLE